MASRALGITRRQETILSLHRRPLEHHSYLRPEGQTVLAFLPLVVSESTQLSSPSLYSLTGTVRAFDQRSRLGLSVCSAFRLGSASISLPTARPSLPSADFYGLVKVNCFTLRHDSVTGRRSPEVSSIAFDAQPPDLPPVCLVEMGFAILCPLARHPRPPIRFLFIGSRLCSTLLSGLASRRVLFRPCASLTLHLHQTG